MYSRRLSWDELAGYVINGENPFSDSRSVKRSVFVTIFLNESSEGVYFLRRTNRGGDPFRFDVSVRGALIFELGAT